MKFEESKEKGFHSHFSKISGNWKGSSKVWFEPGEPIDSAEMKATFNVLLEGRFLELNYESTFQGKPLEGKMIFGAYMKLNRFEVSWIDSFHTGTAIMFSFGEMKSENLNVLTEYPVGENNQQMWGWRTEMEIKNPDHVVIRAYNIIPGEAEALAVEYDLKRA